MRKGWQQKRIRENAWDLHFDRWYLIAPSGNRYHFYRGCHGPTIYVPTTYRALSVNDKTTIKSDVELKPFRNATGKKTKQVVYTSVSDNQVHKYNDVIDDRYEQALAFIYETEEKGGFKDQAQMNQWLANDKEMAYLFAQNMPSVRYNSMP